MSARRFSNGLRMKWSYNGFLGSLTRALLTTISVFLCALRWGWFWAVASASDCVPLILPTRLRPPLGGRKAYPATTNTLTLKACSLSSSSPMCTSNPKAGLVMAMIGSSRPSARIVSSCFNRPSNGAEMGTMSASFSSCASPHGGGPRLHLFLGCRSPRNGTLPLGFISPRLTKSPSNSEVRRVTSGNINHPRNRQLLLHLRKRRRLGSTSARTLAMIEGP
mmetsp:Transcript_16038/g.37902  ORF Transcript_16038/g.37902 Transcript_16038/m.37902 type:complete len:221 (-) Transcript_16038:5244-5906(-)